MREILLFISFILVYFTSECQFHGIVTDGETGEAIPFVSIQIKNYSVGTISDNRGYFFLDHVPEKSSIYFSHINYLPEVYTVEKLRNDTMRVQMFANQRVIENVQVTAKRESVRITNNEKYTVKDFLIWGKEILVFEEYGTYSTSYISRYSLKMELISRTAIENIKFAKKLIKACNERIYIVGIYKVQLLNILPDTITVAEEYGIDFFKNYIMPCALKLDEIIYYQTKIENDLISRFKRYDAHKNSIELITELYDEKLLVDYLNNKRSIQYGSSISTIASVQKFAVAQGRELQRKAEFLENVIFKPKYRHYIFYCEGEVIIMDYINNSILLVENGQLTEERKLTYSEKEGWINEVIQDELLGDLYTFYDVKDGVEIHRIHSKNGKSSLVGFVDIPVSHIGDVQIHNSQLYYKQRKSYVNVNDVIMRYPLKRM